ncbi:MAG: prenyltransferase/squalene oxidase repeat-containing protein [Phycisphaerales bacterium]
MIRSFLTAAFVVGVQTGSALALDVSHHDQGREMATRAADFLRSQQDVATGGWSHNADGPNFPAISGLALTGLLMDPRIDANDPTVRRGLDYVLSYRQSDGGIYDGALPNYNTAICLSALALVHDADTGAAIQRAQNFLRGLQYHGTENSSAEAPDFTEPVPESHPFYGGVGYGRHGRPDLSNLGFFLQALHDTGVSADDPAVQRALVFLSRTQMQDELNDQPYADGSNQGGFIYATVPDHRSSDGFEGQSEAGDTIETLDDGTSVSRPLAYGTMSYTGFKSLIYADMKRDDPRVTAVRRWISEHYTLDENPGLGEQGLYYYYLALARALDAWGEDEIETRDPETGETTIHNWRTEMIDKLASLQEGDGGFQVRQKRWMENDRSLITSYALIALQIATGSN